MEFKDYKFLEELEKTDEYVFHGSNNLQKYLEPRQAHNSGEPDGKPAVFASQEIIVPTFMSVFKPQEDGDSIRCGVSDDFKISLFATQHTLDRVQEEDCGYVYIFDKSLFKHRDHHEWISYKKVTSRYIAKVFRKNIPLEIKKFNI